MITEEVASTASSEVPPRSPWITSVTGEVSAASVSAANATRLRRTGADVDGVDAHGVVGRPDGDRGGETVAVTVTEDGGDVGAAARRRERKEVPVDVDVDADGIVGVGVQGPPLGGDG